MRDEFNNVYELYERVLPALKSKRDEVEGYLHIKISTSELFNLFINNKWKMGHGIMLCDIINDILNTPLDEVKTYIDTDLKKEII